MYNDNSQIMIYSITITRRNVLFSLRTLYLIFGMGYVGYGMLDTMKKHYAKRTVISVTEREFSTMKYPSITFCYPFTNLRTDIRQIISELIDKNAGKLPILIGWK